MSVSPIPSGLDSRVRGALFALSAYALFASFHALGKRLSHAYSSPEVLAMMALAALGPVLLLVRWEARRDGGANPMSAGSSQIPRVRRPGLVMLRGAFSGLSALCLFHALSQLPMAVVYTAVFLGPPLAALASRGLLKEPLQEGQLLTMVLGLLGMVWVFRPALQAFNSGYPAALAVALLFAGSALLLRGAGRDEARSSLLLAHVVGILVCAAPLALAHFRTPSAMDLGYMMLTGGLMALGHLCLIQAFRLAPVALVTSLQYSQLVWGCLFGWALFGEVPAQALLPGLSLIAFSGLYQLFRVHQASRAEGTALCLEC